MLDFAEFSTSTFSCALLFKPKGLDLIAVNELGPRHSSSLDELVSSIFFFSAAAAASAADN